MSRLGGRGIIMGEFHMIPLKINNYNEMKSTITLLIFLLTGFFSYSQNYENIFGEQSTQWNMTIGNLWGIGSTKHTVRGDTLINGKKYKMIDGYYNYEGYLGFYQ